MNKWGIIALCLICLLFGYSVGFTAGAGFAIAKGLNAAEALLDVKLTDKAKQMVETLPEIMKRIPKEERDKLGLNDSEYKVQILEELNSTMVLTSRNKYGR